LTQDEILDHKSFDARTTLLHPYWNTFNHCKSLRDIKLCLERMDSGDYALLVALHEAFANHFVDTSVSFGQTKAAFWAFAHVGHFNYDTFDTYPQNAPVSAVRVDYFKVRPISQWLKYLAWHGIHLRNLPWHMTPQQQTNFQQIPFTVQPRYDFGLYMICKMVYSLSPLNLTNYSLRILHNQCYGITPL
jgi:hypothetical protein